MKLTIDDVRSRFIKHFDGETGSVYASPGRINLIGEHTDYNNGFVFPGAVEQGMIVAVYWAMMLVGRFVGASIGGKVSARAMITTVSTATLVLVLFGMYAPADVLVEFPGVDWGKLEVIW